MRKHILLLGVLILAMVVAGCGNKQEAQSPTASETPAPVGSATQAGEGANTLGDLMGKQAGLTSYVVSVDAGAMKSTMAIKLSQGKPVAMRMDAGPGGWTIIRMDKKMQYIYDPGSKSVMTMPVSADAADGHAASMPDQEAIKALANTKTSSETVDGVRCLKFSSADGTRAYWVEKKHGLPVQVKEAEQTVKFKYDKINSVPDSTFEVPAGVKTMAMPKMPAMPQAPK